ncbi:hypothetical protein TSOC_005741 [Tetrabaena socialis]|uniref:Uncharacterized protein n=1 Tax=Tetrabaena socialis TaxID=47790 RepID=A0A2J8A5H2_9CHLO|nr:hypothetical protein TSOC_005741 [Tetrabaena socialis]|eukprot:PNH07774.1 hypothetical protein TSOC_005741 [Tetrabaena socialis]
MGIKVKGPRAPRLSCGLEAAVAACLPQLSPSGRQAAATRATLGPAALAALGASPLFSALVLDASADMEALCRAPPPPVDTKAAPDLR